jgi:signal transduction histidine kinase
VAGVVDLDDVVAPHVPRGRVAGVMPVGEEAGPGAGLEGLPSQRISLRGVPLTVTAGDRRDVPWAAPTFALVIGSVLLAAAGAAATLAALGRLRAQRDELARSREQIRLVGEVAPLVQQSLELAEVLPAVAVQLMDSFGLRGVRLSGAASQSGQVELFTLGEHPVRSPKPVLQPPDRLLAGEGLTLALQRAGRSVALLEITAGRDLDAADLQSLRAVTELVTAAVVNAALYASQQAAVRRLRDLDALKTVFLGTASHELRTPATAIGGFANLLSNCWDQFSDEQRRDFTERIAANARSLSDVVQDLLDFSLLDRGDLPLPVVPVDLGLLVAGVVDRLAPVVGDHVIDCTTEPAPLVAGAPNGLERVVTNLLTNAVKFSPDGSTVSVAVRAQDGGAAVVVSDEGPGIPPEERSRVFTRFYRGSGDAVLSTRGVGIGLSVVAELADRMHGTIRLDDAPGGGARFTVWLPPVGAGEDRQDDEVEEAQGATTG